jgi:hypothetical protein
LQKNENVVIDGGTSSNGSILSGTLPGVPVNIVVEPKEIISVAEPPSAGSGWKRFAFKAKKKEKMVVTIHWSVVP